MSLIKDVTSQLSLCFILILILMQGCSTQSVKKNQVPSLPAQQVAGLNAELEQLLLKDTLNLKKAKNLKARYQSLLMTSPEYSPAQLSLYHLSYEIEIVEFDINNKQRVINSQRELIRLYLKLPKAVRRELLPPTMVLYQAKFPNYVLSSNIWLSNQYYIATGKMPTKVTKEELYDLILLSAKASPGNLMVRAMAAEHAIDTGNTDFGIAALKEMVIEAPNSPLAPAMLADYYFKDAWNSACPHEYKASLKTSLTYYNNVLERNPESSLEVRKHTSLIYASLGFKPLALNEAKILAESNNFDALWRAAYIFVNYKKFDLAQAAFDKAEKIESFKQKPRGRGYADFLMASGRWSEVAEAYKKYLANREAINSWDTLHAALIAKKLKSMGEDIEYADIRSASSKVKTAKYDWPETLNRILHGGDQSPVVTNACDQLRLAFYKNASEIFNHENYPTEQDITGVTHNKERTFLLEANIFEEILFKK